MGLVWNVTGPLYEGEVTVGFELSFWAWLNFYMRAYWLVNNTYPYPVPVLLGQWWRVTSWLDVPLHNLCNLPNTSLTCFTGDVSRSDWASFGTCLTCSWLVSQVFYTERVRGAGHVPRPGAAHSDGRGCGVHPGLPGHAPVALLWRHIQRSLQHQRWVNARFHSTALLIELSRMYKAFIRSFVSSSQIFLRKYLYKFWAPKCNSVYKLRLLVQRCLSRFLMLLSFLSLYFEFAAQGLLFSTWLWRKKQLTSPQLSQLDPPSLSTLLTLSYFREMRHVIIPAIASWTLLPFQSCSICLISIEMRHVIIPAIEPAGPSFPFKVAQSVLFP